MNLFKWINELFVGKRDWDSFSDADKKSFSPFMVIRYLSMGNDFLPLVNHMQNYCIQDMPHKAVYQFWCGILPKKKIWLKYVKGRKQMIEYPKWALEIISNHYQVNFRTAKEHIEMFLLTEGGMYELAELFGKYGTDPKEIKKLSVTLW